MTTETIELLQDVVERRILAALMEKRAASRWPTWGTGRPVKEIDDELVKLYNADKELRVAWDEAQF